MTVHRYFNAYGTFIYDTDSSESGKCNLDLLLMFNTVYFSLFNLEKYRCSYYKIQNEDMTLTQDYKNDMVCKMGIVPAKLIEKIGKLLHWLKEVTTFV